MRTWTYVADYAETKGALRGRRMPLAWLDLTALDANLSALAERAGGVPIRVATKSVRCRRVLEHALSKPGFRGLMCFSAGEAAWLASEGLDDLLVAYPSVESDDLRACAAATARGVTLRLMVDDAAQLPALSRAAEAEGTTLRVCMDVDMSSRFGPLWFGVQRSPVRSVAGALQLARAIDRAPGIRLDAVMGYEAQIAGVADDVPGQRPKNALIRRLKERSIRELRTRRREVVQALRQVGVEVSLVNGGGTGSLESTRDDQSVTEVTAGSGLYSPALFDSYASFQHRPAAGFAVPVVRIPRTGLYTCHGGGLVASGAAGADRLPTPYLPAGARLTPLEGAGEVQTPVRYDGPERLAIGDPIFFRHAKAGELCEHFQRLWVIEDGTRVEQEWPTYRGEGRCFP